MTKRKIHGLLGLAVLIFIASLIPSPCAWGAIAIDANVPNDQGTPSTNVSTPPFSTTSGNELLLAFVSTDYTSGTNTTVTGISGGGLIWVLVVRTNAQSGTAEIWRAFSSSPLSGVTVTATLSQSVVSSMTVMSFTGVNTSGTNGSGAIGATNSASSGSGAPTVTLVAMQSNSLVFGVGNDWDNAIARTLGTNQRLVHQDLASVGDTYWVQMQNAPTPLSSTPVTINDTAPTGDRYNLSIVEILAAAGGGGSTYSISGTVGPVPLGAGTQLTLSGAASATITADSSGNYTFTNLANGMYTVTPSQPGQMFTPASQTVTVSGGNQPGVNFTMLTWSISGTVGPDANSGSGTLLTLSGPVKTTTTSDAQGNYSFAVLPNGSYTLTPSKPGYTFAPPSQTVTINNGDVGAINFTAQAPTSWSISGTISPPLGSATEVILSGTANAIVVTNANGSYIFTGLASGSYTVTPSKSGEGFSPSSQPVTINGASVSGVNFTASPTSTYRVFGTVGPATAGAGTLLTLNGTVSATTTADTSGNFSFSGVPNGSYTVAPSKAGFTFSPPSQSFYITGFDANPIDFTASSVQTWSISGTLTPSSLGSGALLTLNGGPGATIPANTSGNFSFTGLSNGTYTVTPTKTGYTFVPSSQVVAINNENASANFAVQVGSPQPFNYPDFSSIVPTTEMSIVTVGGSRQFQYTHDIFNGGTGPLEIQPVYNPASGTYQGFQHIYSLSPSGAWRIAQNLPVAGAFVFDPAHGHFHFPMASWGLYKANPDGSVGGLVAVSPKEGFCINDSFIYDPYLPNAGAFSNWGSCGNPVSLRGLSVAAVDEYDQNDEGQNIPIGNVPDGTYWLRMIVDPNNFLAESDKSNNETDVKLLISGNTVQALQTVYPVLNPPPTVSLTAPSNGSTVSGTVQLTASTAAGGVVQFLVDGQLLGGLISSAPYSMSWTSASVPDGSHWLAAQTTDSTGRIGTSPVVMIMVSNRGGVDTVPPTVVVTSPATGSTVSSVVTITANASDDTVVSSVQFYVDSAPLGAPTTTPPYMTMWNTLAATPGTHVLSASAVDSAGLVGTSAPVSVTVDNSHPPNLIGIDASVFVDSTGTMQTPPFSTSTPGDFLVAFVAYDGPSGAPQTATVSGAGLTWTLLKRSNSQSGTAEIWAAKATGTLSSVFVLSQPGNSSGYDGSLTVIAFTNASGAGVVGQAGAPSGAPDIFLPGVAAGSWVFAVGNDWSNAIARTPVSGQVLVHQRVDTATGDTYWVQSTTAPSPAPGLVDIHDTVPTADRWNYAAVEIVATHQ